MVYILEYIPVQVYDIAIKYCNLNINNNMKSEHISMSKFVMVSRIKYATMHERIWYQENNLFHVSMLQHNKQRF